jgi:hypothetical protein
MLHSLTHIDGFLKKKQPWNANWKPLNKFGIYAFTSEDFVLPRRHSSVLAVQLYVVLVSKTGKHTLPLLYLLQAPWPIVFNSMTYPSEV